MKPILFAAFFILSICGFLSAQTIPETTFRILEGHWEGAFIKNNAFQKFDIQFYKKGQQFYSLQVLEEWHPAFGEFVLPVSIDSTGLIKMNTGLGKVVMKLDSNYLELIGFIEGTNPSINVHFKKSPPPPDPDFTVSPVQINNNEITLSGHLHQPNYNPKKTAIILVGGRGCSAGSTKYDLYAKILREYGLSVLVFNKRGTGKSTGDCNKASIEDLASDVVACKQFLENRPEQYENIGILGSSAGGWVMVRAQEMTPFDFLISIVGPSTSVREQQLQSMEYGIDSYKLSEAAKKQLTEYTLLLFDAEANEQNFVRFRELLKNGEKEEWLDLLEDTDIPSSIEDINNLWVRRHSYDPAQALSTFNNPFLAIYGGKDWIVPYKENIKRLQELFSGDRRKLLKTVVAYNAGHSTETEEKYVSFPGDWSYWHFFRISPQVKIELIRFLKKFELIGTN